MHKSHSYSVRIDWTGNNGSGTSRYDGYSRSHEVSAKGKPTVLCSSDPAFRGDSSRYNPEEMLVASLSSCHMLWYLHLCAVSHIIVTEYTDQASGVMEETEDGGGRFKEVTLRPIATVQPEADLKLAAELHERAHELCFIANSVNFPVRCEPGFK